MTTTEDLLKAMEEMKKDMQANNDVLFQKFQEERLKDNQVIFKHINELKERTGVELTTNDFDDVAPPMNKEDRAAQDQAERPFDANDIFDTLIDPHPRTKKELNDYCEDAVKFYTSGRIQDIFRVFRNNFRYWDKSHFNMVKNSHLEIIEDLIVRQGISFRKNRRFALWKAFGQYMEDNWDDETDVASNGGEKDTSQGKNEFPSILNEPAKQEEAPILPTHEESNDDHNNSSRRARPSDVTKMYPRDQKYSGSPTEPLRRRFRTFMDIVNLCQVDPKDVKSMFPLIETGFLCKHALVYFQDVIREKATCVEEVIDLLEAQFLGHRAKRVNDEVWDSLTYEFVKKKRGVDKTTTTHEDVLGDLMEQIANLSDVRTGPGSDTIIMAKTISAVRDVDIYRVVCENPPVSLTEFNAVLRSRALEADRKIVKEGNTSESPDGIAYKAEIKNLVKKEAKRYYIDRVARDGRNMRAKLKGYGRSRSMSPLRVPRHVCIICMKPGCHSSKHRKNAKTFLSNFAQSFKIEAQSESEDEVAESEAEDNDGGESDTSSFISMISASRSFAAMGMYPSHPKFAIDAALIDTGSSHLSTIGELLIPAAQAASVRKTKPNFSKVRTLRGIGNSKVRTIGTLKFHFLFGGENYTIELFIVRGDDPMILSHKDLDRLGLNYQSFWKIIERVKDSYYENVDVRNNLPFLVFETVGFFSSTELRSIHRNLGHPSVEKQMRVIEAAEISDLPPDTRIQLKKIVEHCKACQLNKAKPRRFLFALKDDLIGEFNHVLEIDVVTLRDGPVLHIICSGTGFQQGTFLKSMTAADAWNTLRRSWINIYAGAPDYIHCDAGTNFDAAEFVNAAGNLGVVVKIAPTEAAERIGKIERAHAILKSIYSKLEIDLPDITREDRLSLTFRAINDSPNAETKITPTAMVFGIHPKLPGSAKRGSYAQRAKIVADCTKLATKMKARRIIRESGKRQNCVNDSNLENVRRLAPGSKVLIHRKKEGWKEYPFVKIDGNNVHVILPSGLISAFAIHRARVLKTQDYEMVANKAPERKSILKDTSKVENGPASRTRSKVRFATPISFAAALENKTDFLESRMAELNGLQELGCFEIVDEEEAQNHRIYRHSFVDKIKSDGKKKSRLCVAAFNDKDHGLFTAAPTVKRISIRLMISLCASYGFKLSTRDVKKAFVMSKTRLRRPVYMRAPSEMRIPKGQILKVVRTLYGMPESPMHWFKTYSDYHRDELRMKPIPIDPCLWYQKEDHRLSGILALQVDDTLYGGEPKFLALEVEKSKAFPNAGQTTVSRKPTRFNGLDLTTTANNGLNVDQRYYVANLKTKNIRKIQFTEFRSLRQQLAYASYSTMPDILVYIARMSQYTEKMFGEDKAEPIRLLVKALKVMKAGPSLSGIKYATIPPQLMEIVVCIDAAFATNPDKSSQLGVLVLVRNKESKEVNIIHFTSSKSKRVAKSVLAAELFALNDGYDVGFSIKKSVENMTGLKNMDLTLLTDSQSLYGLVISLAQTTERRLQIDLEMIREGYERREISNIVWIAGDENPADDLTKPDKRNGTLAKLISTGKFDPSAISWIQRDINQVQTKN